ncbi:MAG: DNA polymerase III subunit delta [Acidimicrobiales bacterium]
MTIPVWLVKGSDDVLRGEALTKVVTELVGDSDRTLLVEEVDLDQVVRDRGERGLDGVDLGPVLDAAQTLPFLTDRRIVVVRHFARFTKGEEVQGLVDYLADPSPTTELVLVWEKPRVGTASTKVPASLTKAVKAAGGEILDSGATTGRGFSGWVGEQFTASGLDVGPQVRDLVAARLGEDAGAIVGLIERLKGAYGTGARLGPDEVEPFLGEAGGVPPWDLTDAIDKGDVPLALDRLQRMMVGGSRHPLAVMATLQSHYLRMLRLDGAGVRGEKEAADVLAMKGSTFPAKKALTQANRLGGAGVRRAVGLVADADVDLRGARAWPGEMVMEVLVARLARLSRSRR